MANFSKNVFAFSACFLLISFAMADGTPSCEDKYNKIRQRANQMSFQEFDQSDLGWRQLGNDCPVEQAQLLGAWVKKQESELRLTRWHFAQALAIAGFTQNAVKEALLSRNPLEQEQHPYFKWNTYIQATVEFLRNDRAAFDVQFEIHRTAAEAHTENRTNQKVLVGLANCFGKAYKIAYDCPVSP